ncbi:MAG: nitroreductase family protein, partial [Candidatus Sericytochromatia bacterium]
LSLTDGGDTWEIHPDGRMTRRYEPHPGFSDFLAQVAGRPAVDFSRPAAPGQLLEAAYEAFWSPSATNWQPTRVLELRGEAAATFARLAGWPVPAADFPLLLLLRRDHYESLLGDVLEPFGLEVTAREESIDAGIFAQTLVMAALAQGLTAQEHVFTPGELPEAKRLAQGELAGRLARLEGTSDAMLEREREALATLAAMLEADRYLPDAVVALGQPAGDVTPYDMFPRVVAEHSTQRVASPAGEFGHEAVLRLWDEAVGTLAPEHRGWVRFADFSWHDQVPSRIGKAMFESLYGIGADPESKTGGTGGILTAVTVKNWLLHMAKGEPAHVDRHMPAGWRELDDIELRKAAKAMPVRAADLGRYMRDRLLRDGKWIVQDGLLQDAEGRPLTVPLLVRLMKGLAATFGNFFLKFQNTHPQNAVLLVDTETADLHQAYRAVGQAAAVLTFLSRAEGASSIIKTGPIDLARDPIGRVLSENPDDLPHLRPWKEGLESGRWKPAMTFQVGLPLAGSDVVDAGTPGEHTGYEERKRDKRPPREDFAWHYFPAL